MVIKYKVLVDSNAHYMEESGRYTHGEFATAAEAVAAARALVDAELASLHKPGLSADELFQQYTAFGADPFIVPADAGCKFSAWDYARQRCRELCRVD